MSLFGENRFKNLTAEYVEEQYAQNDISFDDYDTPVNEAVYIDMLLEALDED